MLREIRSFGERVLDRIADLSPAHRQQGVALEKFERQDARARAQVLAPGWYRFVNPNRRVTGFSFMCRCRTESVYLGLDWLQEHKCGTCGAPHSLLADTNLTEVEPRFWEIVLAKLPVRLRQAGQPAIPGIIDSNDARVGGVSGEYEYSMSDPGAGFANPGKGWR